MPIHAERPEHCEAGSPFSSGQSWRSVMWCDVKQRRGEGGKGMGATSCGGMDISRKPMPRLHTDRFASLLTSGELPHWITFKI